MAFETEKTHWGTKPVWGVCSLVGIFCFPSHAKVEVGTDTCTGTKIRTRISISISIRTRTRTAHWWKRKKIQARSKKPRLLIWQTSTVLSSIFTYVHHVCNKSKACQDWGNEGEVSPHCKVPKLETLKTFDLLTLKQFVPFFVNLWNCNGSEGRDRGAEEPSLGSPFGSTC